MKTQTKILCLFLFALNLICQNNTIAQLPQEQPLWPNGIPNNPIKYTQEKLRTSDVRKSSPSQQNRVFSCVSTPTYILHKPEKPNGVALVICPGGGFRDVWFDREGNDFGLWLAKQGITSLVLKYRTFNADAEGFSLKWNEYAPRFMLMPNKRYIPYAARLKALRIDEHKIGISGFSAGGSLSLYTLLDMYEKELPAYANFNHINTSPDFGCLLYPGLRPELLELTKKKDAIVPVFIINGGQDVVTPAKNCIELYSILTSKNVQTELHIYAKGGHGFDSGMEKGFGVSTWHESLLAWLKDLDFIKN